MRPSWMSVPLVFLYRPTLTQDPSEGQLESQKRTSGDTFALDGSGASTADHDPLDWVASRPWVCAASSAYSPAAAHETAVAQATVLICMSGEVPDASGPTGFGVWSPVQPGVGAPAAPAGIPPHSPATAPVPTANAPSTITMAVRRARDQRTAPALRARLSPDIQESVNASSSVPNSPWRCNLGGDAEGCNGTLPSTRGSSHGNPNSDTVGRCRTAARTGRHRIDGLRARTARNREALTDPDSGR